MNGAIRYARAVSIGAYANNVVGVCASAVFRREHWMDESEIRIVCTQLLLLEKGTKVTTLLFIQSKLLFFFFCCSFPVALKLIRPHHSWLWRLRQYLAQNYSSQCFVCPLANCCYWRCCFFRLTGWKRFARITLEISGTLHRGRIQWFVFRSLLELLIF